MSLFDNDWDDIHFFHTLNWIYSLDSLDVPGPPEYRLVYQDILKEAPLGLRNGFFVSYLGKPWDETLWTSVAILGSNAPFKHSLVLKQSQVQNIANTSKNLVTANIQNIPINRCHFPVL